MFCPAKLLLADKSSNRLDEWQRLQTYFNGLRDRGLYSLAETMALRKLADRNVDLVTQTRYAVELSRTYSDHARRATTLDEQTELLDQARSAVSAVIEARRNHPQLLLLQAQVAFVTAHEIELLRWRFELAPWNRAPAERATELARTLIPRLTKLDGDAGNLARSSARDVLEEKLKPHELRLLQRTIRLHLSQVLLDQAKFFPERSADRADALIKADGVLRPLAAIPAGDRIMWQSQLALAEATRLRGMLAAAESMVNAIRNDDPPKQFLGELTAEHVEVLIAQEKFTDAADAIRQFRSDHRRTDARLGYLTALVFLRMSEIASERGKTSLADELRQEVDVAISSIAATGHTYWRERALNLLAVDRNQQTYGMEVGPLVREGQQLFAAGRIDESTARYASAFETASREDAVSAAEVGYTYGSLLLKLKRFEKAAGVFQKVSSLQPKGIRAADADLLRAWCLGMLFQKQPSRERREAYMAALENHREVYRESATAAEAAWMLAELLERRRQTTQALQLFATIPQGHPRYGPATVGMVRCAETILSRLKRLGKSVSEWEPAVVALLSQHFAPVLESESEPGLSSLEFLIRSSRVLLTLQQPDFGTADGLLDFVLSRLDPQRVTHAGSVEDPEAARRQNLTNTALSLRILSLSGLGESEAAGQLLEVSVVAGSDRLSGLLTGLAKAAESLGPESRTAVGHLQLRAVQLAGVDIANLSDEEIVRLAAPVSAALEMTGNISAAARQLEQLLSMRKNDQTLRQRVARLYAQAGGPTDLVQAQEHFRTLEAQQTAGSAEWMATRVEHLEVTVRLKEFEQAEKLLKVTQLLYSTPEDKEIRERLDRVAVTLKSRAGSATEPK